MKFKHERLKKVTVWTIAGKAEFVAGTFETEDKKLIDQLKKNPLIKECKDEDSPPQEGE